uniref:Uncharacterized protein n=1 Tax=Arundo donax TaxID=35708 RepID=A0A0A9C8X8_ARUDO
MEDWRRGRRISPEPEQRSWPWRPLRRRPWGTGCGRTRRRRGASRRSRRWRGRGPARRPAPTRAPSRHGRRGGGRGSRRRSRRARSP